MSRLRKLPHTTESKMQVNIAGMVEVRTVGEFQGVTLGEVAHGCVVGVQPASRDAVERLALLLPYPVYSQRCVRHEILAIAGRKISIGDSNFARLPILQPGQLDAALSVISAWDGQDHNFENLAVEAGEYGPIAVSIDKTGEYVASTSDAKAKKALGIPNYSDQDVVTEEVLVAALDKLDRSRKLAATKAKNAAAKAKADAEHAAARAAEILATHRANFRSDFSLSYSAINNVMQIGLASEDANRNSDALAAAARLSLRFAKNGNGGWYRWLEAPISADYAAIAANLNAKLTSLREIASAAALRRQQEAAAADAAADARRRAAGWVNLTRRSRGKSDGLAGQIVWSEGQPYELVENARKWCNTEPSSISVEGTYDFEADHVWCWTGWAKPAANATALIAARDAQVQAA
jgi:hypothetical protein